jgi:hypothetical protein
LDQNIADTHNQPTEADQEPDICPITQEAIVDKTTISICGHSFSFQGILDWTQQGKRRIGTKSVCPVCRAKYTIINLEPTNAGSKRVIMQYRIFLALESSRINAAAQRNEPRPLFPLRDRDLLRFMAGAIFLLILSFVFVYLFITLKASKNFFRNLPNSLQNLNSFININFGVLKDYLNMQLSKIISPLYAVADQAQQMINDANDIYTNLPPLTSHINARMSSSIEYLHDIKMAANSEASRVYQFVPSYDSIKQSAAGYAQQKAEELYPADTINYCQQSFNHGFNRALEIKSDLATIPAYVSDSFNGLTRQIPDSKKVIAFLPSFETMKEDAISYTTKAVERILNLRY